MQGIKRRVVQVTLYEGVAIVLAGAGCMAMSDAALLHAGAFAVLTPAVAVLWNVVSNLTLESWSLAKRRASGRAGRDAGAADGLQYQQRA